MVILMLLLCIKGPKPPIYRNVFLQLRHNIHVSQIIRGGRRRSVGLQVTFIGLTMILQLVGSIEDIHCILVN